MKRKHLMQAWRVFAVFMVLAMVFSLFLPFSRF